MGFDKALEMSAQQVLETMPRDFGGRAVSVAQVSLDQAQSEVRFSWPDGARAVATAQIVGVYLEPDAPGGDATWQWAWSDTLFQPHMLGHAEAARQFGVSHGIEELTALEVEATVERVWGYASFTAALNGAVGVVGVKSNEAMILATIGSLRPA